ncbi:MAG: hypothetical protein QME96_10410, partial [Myxococcota bacterium]|nr:hypothetical protein [Myxococcota bacterium]
MTPTRMTRIFLAAAATCWVAAACDDGGSARPDVSTDADATPDVEDDGDVPPEVEDLPEATDDGGGGSGTCADPAPLACGDNLRSETTATASSMMDEYSCATGLDQSGPERIYALTVTSNRLVTLVMTPA